MAAHCTYIKCIEYIKKQVKGYEMKRRPAVISAGIKYEKDHII